MKNSQAEDVINRLIENIEKVIIGKRSEITLAVVGLLSEGHILLEDIPGVGKTMLARTIARSLGCSFSRIQFTPDMLPSDLTGVSIFNMSNREFEFRPGPIMAQVVLADEINRATPKTQSALLEAMEEKQVTVDGTTYRLKRPYLVMATQNPIEYEGTFPLPEAQLDRFLIRIRMGYPAFAEEVRVMAAQKYSHPIETIGQIISGEELLQVQETVRDVFIDQDLMTYIVSIVTATREHPDVFLGSSPRGSLSLFRTSQALALVRGRNHVLPDDIKTLAIPVLAHRLLITPGARIKDIRPERIINAILEEVPIPGSSLRI